MILEQIYPSEEVFVCNPKYDADEPVVTVTCRVPPGRGYTLQSIPYVSAEGYVRILSQTSYLLAHHVIERKIISLDISAEELVRAMVTFELYYRNLAMTFHKRVAKGEEFDMTLRLKGWRHLKKVTDFILFSFANDRTVISGEMSFVYAP